MTASPDASAALDPSGTPADALGAPAGAKTSLAPAPDASAPPPGAGGPGAPATGGWHERLTQALGQPVPDAETPRGALGLQFELRVLVPRTSENWNGPPTRALPKPGTEAAAAPEAVAQPQLVRLGARPTMRTARGWARGSLTWANVGHHSARLGLDPDQQRWFRQFHALYRAAEPIAVGTDPNWVLLEDFASPALWSLLEHAATLGIEFVGARAPVSVTLGSRATLALDVRETQRGDLTVAPTLTIDGERVAVADAGAVGTHGIYVAGRGTDRAIRLAPVESDLGRHELALLRPSAAAWPISVPAADRDAFVHEAATRTAAGVRLTSTDGSVTLPEPAPAPVTLRVTVKTRDRIALSWHPPGRRAPGAPRSQTPEPPLAERLPPAVTASDLWPADWDATALTGAVPAPAELHAADSAAFATELLPQLYELPGIDVQVAGTLPRYRALTEPPVLTVTEIPSETTDWFDMGVIVTIEGRTVPFGPLFQALATGKRRLLLADGGYLQLNHPAFAPLLDLIAEAQDLNEWEAGLRVPPHQVPRWADFLDQAEDSAAARHWRALVRAVTRDTPGETPIPETVTATLRDYQRDGFHWLAYLWRHRLGGILADDMGLGKTLQCLTLIAHAITEPGTRGPFVIVAPTSVMTNWAAEARTFVPSLRVRVRSATTQASGRSVRDDALAADVIVTSYALFRLDAAEYMREATAHGAGLAGLILDEAQFAKNANARANELARDLPVAWKLAVTGTPMENSLRELHALCQIVAPGLFPSRRAFEERFVRPIERPAPGISEGIGAGSGPGLQQGLRERRTSELRQRIRPFLLRRTKDLVAAELPEKHEQVIEVTLSAEHQELYEVYLQRERQKLFGLIDDLDRQRFIVFRSLTLLRMLALDAALIDDDYDGLPSAKLEVLVEQAVALAAEGRRALVFSQFTSFLARAERALNAAGVRTVLLDGSTRHRDRVIGSFRRGDADVLLISLKAGGVGLNLTEADTVFLLDPWWNPASEAQAVDRAHRIGQDTPVRVVRLIAVGTIEEKVVRLQQRKRGVFASVIDADGAFSQAIGPAELRAILGDMDPENTDETDL